MKYGEKCPSRLTNKGTKPLASWEGEGELNGKNGHEANANRVEAKMGTKPMPTGEILALQQYWARSLPKGEGGVLLAKMGTKPMPDKTGSGIEIQLRG